MTNLSPAAQAVLTAATQRLYCLDPEDVPLSASEHGTAIAAALRAAADLVVPENYECFTGHLDWDLGMQARNDTVRENLLAIAEELEGAS